MGVKISEVSEAFKKSRETKEPREPRPVTFLLPYFSCMSAMWCANLRNLARFSLFVL